jgi:hypothetical protein
MKIQCNKCGVESERFIHGEKRTCKKCLREFVNGRLTTN